MIFQADETRCNELGLQPGAAQQLLVCYAPAAPPPTDPQRLQLARVTFPVVLKAFSESRVLVQRRTLACCARLCVSQVI